LRFDGDYAPSAETGNTAFADPTDFANAFEGPGGKEVCRHDGFRPGCTVMSKTIFQKIIDREIPAQLIYEDNHVVAFRDINPQAPTHVLLVPRRALPRIGHATAEDKELLGHLMLAAAQLAEQLGLKNGYRLVINNGPDGGESVPHLHCHLLGGRPLSWPPG
jgi:histidine triad (HIT) family protein